ncbi:UDP-N-acetylmuramate dehydrogenase [Bacteroidetes bacterium endosymbiont of Geopemphigus sp.]|uniref:UDP-N-acetylmuramate dehydrogenase n=1 Tax=Bacteroidetes bacterium endosymbiont of Geopemphigus sp. TaxID=2047937 RepID=UPI000CD170E3|nr:UDP-N-acetylmuramate dehydrogenase [Bacteroidetes bacterium endosymbiont of Geopemphigus sp.]
MKILKDFSLQSLNTFGVEAKTKYFVNIQTREEFSELFLNEKLHSLPLLILGGGSNILFRKNYFEGLIIKVSLKGIEIVNEDQTRAILEVAAGENWNELVDYTLEKSWSGLENLSLIPGSVGGAPIQNIGAYGVEIKEVIEELEACEIATGKRIYFSAENCQFGYRDSFFKNEGKDRFIILSVRFSLSKGNRINLSYGALRQELQQMNILQPDLKEISRAVIRLRTRKLPDPKIKGNGGSFFKNPVIKKEVYEVLKKKYPEIVGYTISKNHIKLAAGWLIEKAGWKGRKIGRAGVHPSQALVLINSGGATGEEIYGLSEYIIKDIRDLFGITLEREVRII